MFEEDIRDEVIEAAGSASRRTRRVLMVIQLFSLLVAVMMLNSWGTNWTNARSRTANMASILYECGLPETFGKTKAARSAAIMAWSDDSMLEKRADAWASHCKDLLKKDGVSVDRRKMASAAKWVLRRGYSEKEIDDYTGLLERYRINNVTSFPVPIIGVRIDVNSLGIFAGFGLSIVLLWFGLSLAREYQNIEILKRHYKREILELVQIESLFAPHDSVSRSRWAGVIIDLLPVGAMCIPVVLLVLQGVNDVFVTYPVGKEVDENLAFFTVLMEVALVCLNVALVVWCIVGYSRILGAWRRVGAHEAEEASQ